MVFPNPSISNALNGRTESVLFKDRRTVAWEPLVGNLIDFAVALTFVYFTNRWIMTSSHREREVEGQSPDPSAMPDDPSTF